VTRAPLAGKTWSALASRTADTGPTLPPTRTTEDRACGFPPRSGPPVPRSAAFAKARELWRSGGAAEAGPLQEGRMPSWEAPGNFAPEGAEFE